MEQKYKEILNFNEFRRLQECYLVQQFFSDKSQNKFPNLEDFFLVLVCV